MLYVPILYIQERIIGGAFLRIVCPLFFWHLANKPTISTIFAENHHKTACFLFRFHISSLEQREKIHVGQAACQSNWRGINEAMWDDGSCEKRGRNGFSRGKISFVNDTRASSHRARKLASRFTPRSLSFAANACSRGRKGLIEFLLINCLRGATIIATHELSHYRNCGSN